MPTTTPDTTGAPVRAERVTAAHWRVTFDNPPINLYDPEVESALAAIVADLEADSEVKVVVFDSALPDFFLAHLDLARFDEFGRGMPTWFALVRRLRQARFITVGVVRGRARGIGNEFLTALDVRFACRERAVLGQLEIGTGLIPGCGGIERMAQLVGRARALEVVVSGEDYDADTAERYGWVNRSVPEADLDAVVERFARRVAFFDVEALRAVKEILDREAPAPSAESLAATHERFTRLFGRDSVRERVAAASGLSPEAVLDLEMTMGDRIGPRP